LHAKHRQRTERADGLFLLDLAAMHRERPWLGPLLPGKPVLARASPGAKDAGQESTQESTPHSLSVRRSRRHCRHAAGPAGLKSRAYEPNRTLGGAASRHSPPRPEGKDRTLGPCYSRSIRLPRTGGVDENLPSTARIHHSAGRRGRLATCRTKRPSSTLGASREVALSSCRMHS